MANSTDSTLEWYKDLLDAAFDVARSAVASGALPAATMAIATRDRIIRMESFGGVHDDSTYAIASITKPIFASAVMRLVERGALSLGAPVCQTLPEFSANGKEGVTLWHLLTHTSGLSAATEQLVAAGADRRAIQDAVAATTLDFAPGRRYAYCNVSYAIMARLVETASGVDDVTYLTDHILTPLGMRDTAYGPRDPGRFVEVVNPPWQDEKGRDYWFGLQHPAGALTSTAADLLAFGQAMLGAGARDTARILSPASVREMSRLQTAGLFGERATGPFNAYYGLGFFKSGLGWYRGSHPGYLTPAGFGHFGASGTLLWIEPDLGLVFVFLTNVWGSQHDVHLRALTAAIAARR
jgi:CubicO group peptidase (beta-lactamase class C family)